MNKFIYLLLANTAKCDAGKMRAGVLLFFFLYDAKYLEAFACISNSYRRNIIHVPKMEQNNMFSF